jgi:eukaryotic-like serine/threonine-protein kinase
MHVPELLGGRYELHEVLGRGGMAEVRAGWDVRLGRRVAIKLLYPPLSAQAEIRRRFEVEARSAAGLSNPHVVAVHDFGEHGTTPFIVMEQLPGRTLADAIAQGPLALPQVRRLLDEVLSALAAAHQAGILHRDMKPGNILLAADGTAKVADFGIAKSAESADTMTGQVVGTMGYLSAARLAGRPAAVADDLYAVGVVGYEALSGRRPFPQDNLAELVRAVTQGRPDPLAALRPDADVATVCVIERALSRDPRLQFGSATQMRAALPGGLPVRPPTQVLDNPLPEPVTAVVSVRPRGGPGWVIAAVGAVVAVVITVLALAVDSASRSNAPQPVGTTTPAATSPLTSAPTSVLPPAPAITPIPGDDAEPPKGPGKKNGNGNGNGHKPKHGGD